MRDGLHMRHATALLVLAVAASGAAGARADDEAAARPCRLAGVAHEALCGSVRRPLDPAQPGGASIEVHYAVLPALARRKAADPVLFFAGGPGQSAIELAGPLARRFARLGQRRDLVFVDQRGTGRSAPLTCPDDDRPGLSPLADVADRARRLARIRACGETLQRLPHGDLRRYTTAIAAGDVDAVRAALGVERFNAIGFSYGTRMVLELQRQFPQRLRRAVLDGAAPPDMALPASASPDPQSALDALLSACEADARCRERHPALAQRWRGLLGRLPVEVEVEHPASGRSERITVGPDFVLGALRGPLSVPALAAGLPAAIDAATRLRFGPLLGLATALGAPGAKLASGMHFSVVCAEDVPRLDRTPDRPGADFGVHFADFYREVCAHWPAGAPPEAFERVGPAVSPTWVLSGGADPATPPRHGERVVAALGPRARHVVVPQAGHGVLALACVRDAVQRFVEAAEDDAALGVDASCAAGIPRPPAFVPPGAAPESR